MKKFLIGFVIAIATFGASAQIDTRAVDQAGFSGLSDTQKAEIISQITKAKTENGNGATPKQLEAKAEKWVDLGERMGKMLGGAAKEVGVAVNEFVKTPVGQMTMALIIWSYMGNAIVHVFGGLLVIFVGLFMCWYWSRRSVNEAIHYHPEKTTIFGNPRVLRIEREELSTDATLGFSIASGIVIGAGLITMFSF